MKIDIAFPFKLINDINDISDRKYIKILHMDVAHGENGAITHVYDMEPVSIRPTANQGGVLSAANLPLYRLFNEDRTRKR